jgi:DNA-nicking Smr family endonuclease
MDEDDAQLFRKAMRGVRRIHAGDHHASTRSKPRPRARFARAERHAVLEESMGVTSPLHPVEETGDALLFRRPTTSSQALRRLRGGQYRVELEIDLHGLTAAHVEPALRAFLAEALRERARVVRVIHGKGLRSGNRGPVLKQVASNYLRRVGAVLAFASAREVDGGSGALLVLLEERPRRPRRRGT